MNTSTDEFLKKLSNSKIIIILRNIKLDQVEDFVGLLESNGLDTIEITLNSPEPFKSIELVSKKFPKINIGAGTVILKNDILKLLDKGAKFIVSPNTNPEKPPTAPNVFAQGSSKSINSSSCTKAPGTPNAAVSANDHKVAPRAFKAVLPIADDGILVDDDIESFANGLIKIYERRDFFSPINIQKNSLKYSWKKIVNENMIPFIEKKMTRIN